MVEANYKSANNNSKLITFCECLFKKHKCIQQWITWIIQHNNYGKNYFPRNTCLCVCQLGVPGAVTTTFAFLGLKTALVMWFALFTNTQLREHQWRQKGTSYKHQIPRQQLVQPPSYCPICLELSSSNAGNWKQRETNMGMCTHP